MRNCLSCVHCVFHEPSHSGCDSCGYGIEDGSVTCKKGHWSNTFGFGYIDSQDKKQLGDLLDLASKCPDYQPEPWSTPGARS